MCQYRNEDSGSALTVRTQSRKSGTLSRRPACCVSPWKYTQALATKTPPLTRIMSHQSWSAIDSTMTAPWKSSRKRAQRTAARYVSGMHLGERRGPLRRVHAAV